MRRQLLTLVSSVTGAPTGEAVLAKALDRTVPWPKWQARPDRGMQELEEPYQSGDWWEVDPTMF